MTSIIEQLVADEFDTTVERLHVFGNTRSISWPRQVAMTLMHESGTTWATCAIHFGMSDHTTAIYAAKSVARRERSCATYAARLQSLRTTLAALGFQPLGSSQTTV